MTRLASIMLRNAFALLRGPAKPGLAITLLLAACAACGDDGDSTADAAPPDPCMPEMTFTGEFVDWDSSTSAFMGIPQATFTHRTDTAKTDVTAPNGRFDMCIPAADGFVDVTTMAGSTYVAGAVIVDQDVIKTQGMLSLRSFRATRAADFGFDAAMGHVYVHVIGGARTIASSAAAGVTKTFDGTTWTDGNAGTDVYLGNIAGTSTMISVTGGNATGAATVPLTPGAFTYLTIVAR